MEDYMTDTKTNTEKGNTEAPLPRPDRPESENKQDKRFTQPGVDKKG